MFRNEACPARPAAQSIKCPGQNTMETTKAEHETMVKHLSAKTSPAASFDLLYKGDKDLLALEPGCPMPLPHRADPTEAQKRLLQATLEATQPRLPP